MQLFQGVTDKDRDRQRHREREREKTGRQREKERQKDTEYQTDKRISYNVKHTHWLNHNLYNYSLLLNTVLCTCVQCHKWELNNKWFKVVAV